MTTASSKTSESALDSADTGSNVGSELDGACFGEDAAGHDTWVMCDTCSKWRRVYSADSIDTEAFFACSMLIGWSCNQPEVEYVGAAGTASAVESDNLNGDNRRKKGWRGSAKRSIRRTVGCKTCQASMTQLNRETAASALERHYRAAPSCRPVADATPTTIVNLVLDLSDRIPYRGVISTDPRLWDGFAVRATKVKTFPDACGELYWLANQLKPEVIDKVSGAAALQKLSSTWRQCRDPKTAFRLFQSIELAAIDWTVVHSLWAVEKREQAKQVHPKRDRRGHSTAKKYDGDTSSVSSDTGGVVAVKRPRLVESDERSLEGADWPPVGTLVEVLLDDEERSLAVVSKLPVSGAAAGSEGAKHEITFLGVSEGAPEGQLFVLHVDDTLNLMLPNEFVTVLSVCTEQDVSPG